METMCAYYTYSHECSPTCGGINLIEVTQLIYGLCFDYPETVCFVQH